VAALRARRVDGLAGELALTLDDGRACPVCGSHEHPVPAPVNPDHVSAELIEEREQQLSAQREQLESFRTTVAVLSASVPDTNETATPAVATRTAMLDALQGDLDTLTGINAQIDDMRTQRAAAESTRDDLFARITTDRRRIAVARGEFASVADRVAALRLTRTALLDFREALAILAQADAQLAEVVGEGSSIAGNETDIDAAKAARDEASAAARRATAASTAAVRVLQVVTDLCAQLDVAQARHDWVIQESAATIRLAQALTGSGGQSLSAYVVQRAIDEVVEAANARLVAMLGGHFRLVTTGERTGSRRTGLGLGLKVRDLRTDTERRTTTLSGGETFCASLALALGLADSVRAHAGGIEIGMLFIDEGFGALDVERLGDVMAELLRLRADGRSVGVISHVTEMKRAIYDRVDVLPAASGSTLSVRWMN
jgi:exonuclease SbcC